MTADIANYVAPKYAVVTLPDNLGSLEVRPMRDDIIDVTTHYLLLGDNIYHFSATLKLVGDRWYYLNKAEIGVTGGRPSPKRAATTLEKIAAYLNEVLATDAVFQGQLEELRKEREIIRLQAERRELQQNYKYARREVERAVVNVANYRRYINDAEEEYQTCINKLREMEEAHPELLEEPDIN